MKNWNRVNLLLVVVAVLVVALFALSVRLDASADKTPRKCCCSGRGKY